MRIEDHGKVAATFVDTLTCQAVRIAPRRDVRRCACEYAPEVRTKWDAQLLGYQWMPAEELLSIQAVQLNTPLARIISRAGCKAICDICGEEIMNEREIVREGMTLCKSCAGQSYYSSPAEFAAMPLVLTQMEAA